jgi:glycine cleavage system aminomethyltransferase T
VEVTGVLTDAKHGRVTGVRTAQGDVRCEVLVNCAGQWARQFGALAGVNVPLYPAEHFYIVTDRIEGVHPMLPVMRDPDGFIYYKEEVGGLLMGGFEPVAKPWRVDPIPSTFQFQLLDEDWDQFEPLMTNAIHRTPCLETAKVKMLLNGPESFTPDGNFILGEAPELRGYFVCAGFNSRRHRQQRRRRAADGRMDRRRRGAQRPVGRGHPPLRRPSPPTARRWPSAPARRWACTTRCAGRGRNCRPAGRCAPRRCTTCWPRKGAEFGSQERLGARQLLQARRRGAPADTLGRPGWLPWVIAEQRATREAVALYDQTSFGKLLLQGRDALAVLQRLCANEIDVPAGRMVYTAMLNARGGFESDLTVMRLAADRFLLVTGSAQPVRDADWINRHIGADQHAVLTDVSALWSVLSVMGPAQRNCCAREPRRPVARRAEVLAHAEIDLGHARVRAARMSYVGGPGFELYVPVEMTRHVYLALQAAGADLGLRDAGYYALDALRIEAGRRAWGAELGPDETPLEAGLMFGVKLDKRQAFIGRDACCAAQGQPLRKKLLSFVFDDPAVYAWGGETIVIDGQPWVSSARQAGARRPVPAWPGLRARPGGTAGARRHTGAVDLWGQPVPPRPGTAGCPARGLATRTQHALRQHHHGRVTTGVPR